MEGTIAILISHVQWIQKTFGGFSMTVGTLFNGCTFANTSYCDGEHFFSCFFFFFLDSLLLIKKKKNTLAHIGRKRTVAISLWFASLKPFSPCWTNSSPTKACFVLPLQNHLRQSLQRLGPLPVWAGEGFPNTVINKQINELNNNALDGWRIILKGFGDLKLNIKKQNKQKKEYYRTKNSR